MEIRTLASTSADGRVLNQEVIMDFSGKMAGICYTKESLDEIWREPREKVLKLAKNSLESNNHDVFGHENITLFIGRAPRILAMVLNNEGYFNASEKSGRQTAIELFGLEKVFFEKWKDRLSVLIAKKYPDMDKKMIEKCASQNASYLISIFTPSVDMIYSTSIQQINYIVGWMREFVARTDFQTEFEEKLALVYSEFIRKLDPNLIIPGLIDPDSSGFSLFGKRERADEWGENYSFSYYGSFAELAEVQLLPSQIFKKIHYEFSFFDSKHALPGYFPFYVPIIIEDSEYEREWLADAEILMDFYPQGMMVRINERGTCEDFVLKCSKMLCGQVQLEACTRTASTLSHYFWGTKDKEVRKYLRPYVNLPRCNSFCNSCDHPCFWGPDRVFSRLV